MWLLTWLKVNPLISKEDPFMGYKGKKNPEAGTMEPTEYGLFFNH